MKRASATKSNETTSKKKTRFVIENRTKTVENKSPRLNAGGVKIPVLVKRSPLIARVTSLVLVSFFLCVPIGDAYADTSVATDTPTVPVPQVSPEVTPVLEVPPSIDTALPADAPVTATTGPSTIPSVTLITATSVESTFATSTLAQNLIPTSTAVSSTVVGTSSPATTSEAPITTPVITASTSATTTVQVPLLIVPVLQATTTRMIPVAATATPLQAVATTTDVPILTHTTDADRLAFSTTECVPLGNGAFHCVRASDQATTNDAHGNLYSARDAHDGDLEIYMKDGTKNVALTNNDYDDDAPTQDPISGDIVWHSLINDRYQIVEYDKASGATTRITKETYNSMQPAIYGGDIVFQSWIGNNWEIVLIDKTHGRVQLTDNATHDIAPSINENYIMWQAFENNAWVAKVYDRHTKKIETVKGLEGGKVENPRMVLVFDNKKENGDVETLGYDPASGTVSPLASEPAPLPPPIPVPQNQKEDKVLPQVSTTTRIETKVSTTTGSGAGNGNPDPLLQDTTPSPATTTAATASTSPLTVDTTGSTTISMTTGSDGTSTSIIPDLVIPAFNGSQDVASTTTL